MANTHCVGKDTEKEFCEYSFSDLQKQWDTIVNGLLPRKKSLGLSNSGCLHLW
ncbi:hypothetical protein AMTR_s00042p00208670, partial [Amborella trichopoda]